MKKISNILKCFTIIAIALNCIFAQVQNRASADSWCEVVIEKTSGRILCAKNENKKMPMASTTKILTAITVIENFDLGKIITVPKCAAMVEGSSVYLKEGEKFTTLDLLYGLMLRSGNDCAETLATTLTSSRAEFIELMNKTAKKCGAENSNFVNPHGLHDDEHYTTCLDLAKISAYAMQNPTFKKIVSSKSYIATELTANEKRVWTNKNKMLTNFDGATGIKTGYTKKAGGCLVSSAERDGMELICVVLNHQPTYERSSQILNQAFEDYRLVKVIDSSKFDYFLPNKSKSKYFKLKVYGDEYYPIAKNESVKAQINLPEYLLNPPLGEQKIGEIKIFVSKQLIFSKNIYTLK